jgi:hypothetical protein
MRLFVVFCTATVTVTVCICLCAAETIVIFLCCHFHHSYVPVSVYLDVFLSLFCIEIDAPCALYHHSHQSSFTALFSSRSFPSLSFVLFFPVYPVLLPPFRPLPPLLLGKFTPMKQWFYFDGSDSLSDQVRSTNSTKLCQTPSHVIPIVLSFSS